MQCFSVFRFPGWASKPSRRKKRPWLAAGIREKPHAVGRIGFGSLGICMNLHTEEPLLDQTCADVI